MITDPQPLANPRIRDVIAERVSKEAQLGWLFEHNLTVQDREATLRAVFLNGQPRWRSAFAVMLLLASGVATLGLSQNSVATIIGAMIIAPLGQPIVALGAAVAMAWSREASRLLLIVMVGAGAVIVWAYLISLVLLDVTPNDQILSRTAPDVRDLGIALLAGGAGAYGYVRDELSGVLPGVAIAVALVPPLAVVGMMLELGNVTLALGALTLFVANLVGVAFAAGLVILLTGFAPMPRLRRSPLALASFVILIVALLLVAWPLGKAYRAEARAARTMTRVQSIARQEAAAGGTTVRTLTLRGDTLTVALGDTSAVQRRRFENAVREVLGPDATLRLVPRDRAER